MYTDLTVEPELLAKLPDPAGYRILIVTSKVNEKTKGGVYLPEDLRKAEDTATIIGKVLRLGPEAYNSKERFPTGPYCGEGDYIIFRSYGGTRFKLDGVEFRLLNDDAVEAVVADPSGYERAF